MRIGYVIQNGAPDFSTISGPQLHTVAVIDGLRRLGHDVRTLANQSYRLGWTDDLTTWQTPTYGFTRSAAFRWSESLLRRLQTELRLPFVGVFDSVRFADACAHDLRGADILYERHGYMGYGGLVAARRMGVPHVLELNGNILREIDEMGVTMSSAQRALGRYVTIETLRRTDHLVVVSDALKNQIVTTLGLAPERVSVVLNGADVRLFQQPYDVAAVRASLGVAAAPLLVFVGSFQPWHGVDLLVDAFADVRRRVPQATLVLIGDGEGRAAAEERIRALALSDAVHLLGRQRQARIAEVLAAADVLVAPYPLPHGDIVGTPLKLMEYMAAGRAIVASTAPIHEIVEHEVTGLRVAPANATALAGAIVRLLGDADLRATLGARARAAARDFSWDHVVERLAGILEVSRRGRVRRRAVVGAWRLT
ncbi:MAG: glycosyltransferase family 4 protein [Vicinamibacterales bacterium]